MSLPKLDVRCNHSMFNIVCGIEHCRTPVSDKINYNKGNYEDFRQYINICWDKYFCNCTNDIDKIWNLFKSTIEVGINKFIPKVSKFGTWKKSAWNIPLSKDTCCLIKQKRKMWHKYVYIRNKFYFRRFKELRNKIRNETIKKSTI